MSSSLKLFGGGGGKEFKFQEFLASGTFTPSAGLLAAGGIVQYELKGAGGGGQGATGAGGAMGGGSSCRRGIFIASVPVSITIAAASGADADGSSSSIGAIVCAGGKSGTNGGGAGSINGYPAGPASLAGAFHGTGGGEGGGSSGASSTRRGGDGLANSGGGGGGGGGATGVGTKGGSGYALLTWLE